MERKLWCELCDLVNDLACLEVEMLPSWHQEALSALLNRFDAFIDRLVELRLHDGAANTYEAPRGHTETPCDV